MAIKYYEKTKIFHLFNDKISYIIRIMENNQAEQLYYGKRVHNKENFEYLHDIDRRAQMSICVPEPDFLSLYYTKQEYPSYGTGDYRYPAFTVLQENGSRIVNFEYKSHKIYKGKKSIEPLPSTYVENENEAETLELIMYDCVTETELTLSYTIFNDYPVITRNARFSQTGSQKIVLERALSASVELPDMEYEMLHFAGSWGRERYIKTRKLEIGVQSIHSTNGTCSSAEHNPSIILKRPETTENNGEVYGFSLVYSGNFLAQVEVNSIEITRITMGINPENFAWVLNQGDSFQTPEVVMVYSDMGLNNMSQTFHNLYRSRLMRGKWRDMPRPILLNNWEATYFDINEEKLLEIAKKAKEVGVELFVLDDGWFGSRTNDRQGLGDWTPNIKRLPNGLSGLSEKIEALGLKFGFWVELEMVNKDSDLYRAHPDWIISTPNRFECYGRNQYVLDYSRSEVVEYIYNKISKVIRNTKVSYIKWDMNRNMTEPYSKTAPPDEQGMMMHKYILGVYELYNRLTKEFPEILFESCASGGSRFDAGMLYYAPQAWCSDDSDANERTKIQYGTSYIYPTVSMGAHISATPNHQLYRYTPIETRASIAYFGAFGYELDLNLLSQSELEEVKRQIEFMKKHRELIQIKGDFYRLKSPFKENDTAWIVVSPQKDEAIAMYYQRLNKVNAPRLRFKLNGLNPNYLYEISCDVKETVSRQGIDMHRDYEIETKPQTLIWQAYGDELMNIGILIDRDDLNKKGGDFSSLIYVIKKVEDKKSSKIKVLVRKKVKICQNIK